MKLRTALLFIGIGILVVLPALFLFNPDNQATFATSFTFWGAQLSVAAVMAIIAILAAVLPSIYFTLHFLRYRRQVKADQRHLAQEAVLRQQLEHAKALMAHDKPQEVITELEDPKSPEARYLKAQAHLRLEHTSDAVILLTENMEPLHPPSAYMLIDLKTNGQDREELIEALIDHGGDHAIAARHLLIQVCERRGDWERCAAIAKELEQLDHPLPPKSVNAYEHQQILALEQPKQRVDRFKKMIRKTADFTPAYLDLAAAHLELGQVERAFDVYEQGYQATGHAIFLDQLETYYLEQNQPEDAIRIYRELMVRDQQHTVIRQLGRLYLRLSMVAEAAEILTPHRDALSQFPAGLMLLAELGEREKNQEGVVQIQRSLIRHLGYGGERYRCTHCGTRVESWKTRCSHCGSWDTIFQEVGAQMTENIPQNPIRYE